MFTLILIIIIKIHIRGEYTSHETNSHVKITVNKGFVDNKWKRVPSDSTFIYVIIAS